MPRGTRYGLFFASLLTMILLAISMHRHGGDPALASRPIHDWDIPELADHLNRRGMEVKLQTVPKHGPVRFSAYLTSAAKGWRDLNVLSKDPRRIAEWRGVLYCERVRETDLTHLLEQWGDRCLVVGPFLLYGDAELLDRVRAALAEFAPSEGSRID